MKLEVASPCTVAWDEMTGSDRVRFCSRCHLNVYNLSEMAEGEAEELVHRTEGRLCVRFYRRADGTVMGRECWVGWRRHWIPRLVTVAGLLLGGASIVLAATSDTSNWSVGRVVAWFDSLWEKPATPQVVGQLPSPRPPPSNP